MKRIIVLVMVLCMALSGCADLRGEGGSTAFDETTAVKTEENAALNEDSATESDESAALDEESAAESDENAALDEETAVAEDENAADGVQAADTRKIAPLPEEAMDNLTDAILSVSLEEGGVYVDKSGIVQMEVAIYAYDRYDMVDIAGLKIGDIIIRHTGEVEVVSIEHGAAGGVYVNGGPDAGGFALVTDDGGVFFERGLNDTLNWYEAGKAVIRVSDEFKCLDGADIEQGEVAIRAESFLNGEIENYDFTPYNTTVRVENGQIVEMNRVYTP